MKYSRTISFFNFVHHKLNYNHKSIRNEICQIIKQNKNNLYDYGEGFFYQSVPPISLKGLRDTKKRIDKLNLENYLKNSTFLDIGTNIGSIPLSLNTPFALGVGIDHNESTIEVAETIQKYLDIKNIEFISGDFINYEFNKKFDVILSLANHTTFDKGIDNPTLYFDKIYSLLNKKGILIIESHNPLYEKSEIYLELIKNLEDDYETIEYGKYDFGNFYDLNRLFHVLKKK
jgi:2-polyprenyl-3-methyl-5-hydroxy-6-metoxy-1,4-benzoquinol methylase